MFNRTNYSLEVLDQVLGNMLKPRPTGTGNVFSDWKFVLGCFLCAISVFGFPILGHVASKIYQNISEELLQERELPIGRNPAYNEDIIYKKKCLKWIANIRLFLKLNFYFSMSLVQLAALQSEGSARYPMLIGFLFSVIDNIPSFQRFASGFSTDLDNVDEDDDPETFKANSMYLHLAEQGPKVWLVFFGQVALALLYFNALQKQLDDSGNEVNYAYWFLAVVAVQGAAFVASDGMAAGEGWAGATWGRIMQSGAISLVPADLTDSKTNKKANKKGRDEWDNLSRPCFLKFIRMMQALLVNAILRSFIIITIPSFLMKAESAMDFVKDAVAIAFVTTLDDVGDPPEYFIFGTWQELQDAVRDGWAGAYEVPDEDDYE